MKKYTDLVDNHGKASGKRSAERAVQAWNYLIGCAYRNEVSSYNELRKLMKYADCRPLSHILGCVMWYCQQNDLPPLTVLVPNDKGLLGEGYTASAASDVLMDIQRVHDYSWYEYATPTAEDFFQARQNAKKA